MTFNKKNISVLAFIALFAALLLSPLSQAAINIHPLYLESQTINDYTHKTAIDANGYFWIATDNGVKLYDGYQVFSYVEHPNVPPSFLSNNASLMIDNEGDLWAGGSDLVRYQSQKDKFETFEISDGANIWALHQDNNGIIWVGGASFGLKALDPISKQVVHELFNGAEQRLINIIEPHGDGESLWIVTGNQIYLLNTQSLAVESYPWVGNTITALIETQQGKIWISTTEGVWTLNPTTKDLKHYAPNPGVEGALQSHFQVSLFEDKDGNVWIGSDKQGVHKYQASTDTFVHLPASRKKSEHFPPGAISSISQDKSGTLWFTVGSFGVYRISQHLEKFNTIVHSDDDDNSLGFNNVTDLYQDRYGDIWIATDGGGLDRYNPNTQKFVHYRHDANNLNSISSDSVLTITEDKNNNLWFGTYGGALSKFNRYSGTFTRYKPKPGAKIGEGLSGSNIYRVVTHQDDKLLLSLWNRGLQIFDTQTQEVTTFFPGFVGQESGIKNADITEIEPTSDDNYWIAGTNGVELFDTKAKKFHALSLPDLGDINDLYQDNDYLWIAAERGLIRYHIDSATSTHYQNGENLANNFITSIQADEQGFLWLGTRNGLNRFNPKTSEFNTFDKFDGLAGNQFNRYSHLLSQSGKMYFGGVDGISTFYPAHLPLNDTEPKAKLTSIKLFNKEINHYNSEYLDGPISQQSKLVLPHTERDIAFEFTALSFIAPQKNRYRYRLLGLESEWTDATSNRRWVRYTNLAPKKYVFELMAANNDGVWSKQPKQLEIIILPPWWQTWWARIFFVAVLLAMIFGFIQWRLIANRRREVELQRQVELKTVELAAANSSVRLLNTQLEKRVQERTEQLVKKAEQQKETEAKLFHMAFHDPLTDLPNRPWLLQQLERNINQAVQYDTSYALMFIDGDRFKKTNDTLGHIIGDKLLVESAKRLVDKLPKNSDAIRLGGDEFTVLVNQLLSEQQIHAIAEDIIEAFNEPFYIDQYKIFFRVSIGVVIGNKQYVKPEEVLRDADIAMYRAKQKGRGCYQLFDTPMRKQEIEDSALELDLTSAIERDQLFLVYQPIVDLADSRIVSFESLLRWRHPEHGLVPPDRFIPLAEETGQIVSIGIWVFEQACKQLAEWRELIGEERLPTLAINLSPRQLNQSDLISHIDAVLEKNNIDGSHLKLEITETVLMENYEEVCSILECLRDRRIELAIDDFGTGYSSLSYLDKLPVQVLKIDRSFVDSLISRNENHEGTQEIIKATISLAHNLNIKVVAEGIETSEQLEFLIINGCDFGQGYFIDRPLSCSDATKLLETDRSKAI